MKAFESVWDETMSEEMFHESTSDDFMYLQYAESHTKCIVFQIENRFLKVKRYKSTLLIRQLW